MTDIPLLRFIPFRRSDLVQMCLAEAHLTDEQQHHFTAVCERIEAHFQAEFHGIKSELKALYAPSDPDADTRAPLAVPGNADVALLGERITEVLERANYERVTPEGLAAAFRSASLFRLRLHVELDDFAEVVVYTRGANQREEELPLLFGLIKRRIQFVSYDRVVLYLRFRQEADSRGTLGGYRPGATMLKLFQNVPDADLEMLFPNTRVGMRLIDKLLIAVPAVASGAVVFATKLGATMVLLGALVSFWLGLRDEPVQLDKGALLALGAGLGALAGYLWKQFSSFRNRRLQFTQALTENLYFKLLDNNAGVLFRILDDAEESECKEALLAYCFLLQAHSAVSAADLDQRIEAWLAQHWQCRIDFEIEDALNKLHQLQLAQQSNGLWQANAQADNGGTNV